MILLALLLQAAPMAADPGDAPKVPAAGQAAFGAYLDCLFEPLESTLQTGEPEARPARVALVRDTLIACRAQRDKSAADMERLIPRTGEWSDPAARKTRIEDILAKLEQRVSFSVISREEFLAVARSLGECVAQNEGSAKCQPVKAK